MPNQVEALIIGYRYLLGNDDNDVKEGTDKQ